MNHTRTDTEACGATPTTHTCLDCESLRNIVADLIQADPGELRADTPLDAAGLSGFNRLRLIAAIEDRYGIDFPADLVTAVETVADLVHYTNLKAGR